MKPLPGKDAFLLLACPSVIGDATALPKTVSVRYVDVYVIMFKFKLYDNGQTDVQERTIVERKCCNRHATRKSKRGHYSYFIILTEISIIAVNQFF